MPSCRSFVPKFIASRRDTSAATAARRCIHHRWSRKRSCGSSRIGARTGRIEGFFRRHIADYEERAGRSRAASSSSETRWGCAPRSDRLCSGVIGDSQRPLTASISGPGHVRGPWGRTRARDMGRDCRSRQPPHDRLRTSGADDRGDTRASAIAKEQVRFEPFEANARRMRTNGRRVWRVVLKAGCQDSRRMLFETAVVEIDAVTGGVVSVAKP
jgi:hypothetical protein